MRRKGGGALMKTVAIIPARGGSKGIPRKNMRLLHGRPLIEYAILNALESSYIDDVVVSSDSEEILSFASQFEGVSCLNRLSDLALDPVIYDAVKRQEEKAAIIYDIVVTMQPTSPLLSVETLDSALRDFCASNSDSMISVVNAPRLSWKTDATGAMMPSYKERLNRHQLPPHYLETGAFFISRREAVTPQGRLGKNVSAFEVPETEAVDIDTKQDWVVCESLLSRKRIVFRVDGSVALGMGHIYRALTLAYALTEHDILFACDASQREGVEKLRSANMNVVEFSGDSGFVTWLSETRPDILVNDRLDTSADFMGAVKPLVGRLVSFEDLGAGARCADAVVNALYEGASPHVNTFTGKRYVCLRDEFIGALPSSFSSEVRRILVLFGGSDPSDFTSRIYTLAKNRGVRDSGIEFDFILGPGYKGQDIVSDASCGITVSRDVARVSDRMRKADLAICCQGRTTFELACMGVPAIVIAQNEREQLHTFAQMNNGFINLGLGKDVSDEDIDATIEWLIGAVTVRREMRKLMLSNDLRAGIDRVKRIILGEVQ